MTKKREGLVMIESLSSLSPRGDVDEANRNFEEFFSSVREVGKKALLHIPFQHRHIGPTWSYVPEIKHQTIILSAFNRCEDDLYVPSPYNRDAATHQLVGMKASSNLSEGVGGLRFDVVPNQSTAIFSLFADLSAAYKQGVLVADIKVR